MAISESEIAQVRSATDIVALISETVALKKSGRRWTGLCPFHGEKTPSFSVNAEEGRYYCFGCRASGDQITFVREIQHLDFMDALRLLADRAGIELHDDANAGPARKERQEAMAAMEKAVTWYHDRLLNAPDARPAREYLKSRGIGGDIARQFKLGWAPDEWDGLAKGLKFTEKVLMDTGLGFVNKGDRRQDALRARDHLPDLRSRRARPSPSAVAILPPPYGTRAAARRPHRGEVQELARDLDLLQAPHALRAQLGQGRRHQVRRDHRVRGLHRRHRLLHGRHAARRRDLRHRARRRALQDHAQLRQTHRPRLRRRQGRTERGRLGVPVGAPKRGRRLRRAPAQGSDPAELAQHDPEALRKSVDRGRPVLALPTGPRPRERESRHGRRSWSGRGTRDGRPGRTPQ